jgi:chemotaxis protein CheY-P-specific phosphatase CheC
MARCLPGDWPVEISYAANGKEGLDVIRAGKGEVVFLDLNMPEMDGFEVLEHIQSDDLNALSIVVSGDVQEESYSRVKKLGALDFIKKPVSTDEIIRILHAYGIHEPAASEMTGEVAHVGEEFREEEAFQEMANVALGRAVKLLAQYLDSFVEMSIPHASNLALGELQMTLQHVSVDDRVSAVSQGFVGSGISGEALLIFNESNIQSIAELLKYEGEINDETQLELFMDIANILIGACLSGVSEQIEVKFSQGHPQILRQHAYVSDVLVERGRNPALTIEMGCSIEDHDIDIELLLMFTSESMDILRSKLNYMVS